jgi:putative thioredoxin
MIEINESNFETEVLVRSHEMPVLVDFWADWCAPCKSLMPVLDKLYTDYQGQLQIVKINTDEQRSLAEVNGIRSLPTLRLYRDGEVVEEVMGAQPESVLRELIDPHLLRASNGILQDVQALASGGQTEAAIKLLEQGVQDDPGNPNLPMALARLCMADGQLERAAELLESLPRDQRDGEDGKNLKLLLEFARVAADADDPDTLSATLRDNPGNAPAWHQLGAQQIVNGDYSAALESFMELLKCDRTYADNAAQKGLIALFGLLGENDERVGRYRRQMANLLL